MKCHLSYTTLVRWFIANAIITICFGVYLGIVCIFPSVSPYIRALIFAGNIDIIVPYIIFVLIVSSIVTILYFYDLHEDGK